MQLKETLICTGALQTDNTIVFNREFLSHHGKCPGFFTPYKTYAEAMLITISIIKQPLLSLLTSVALIGLAIFFGVKNTLDKEVSFKESLEQISTLLLHSIAAALAAPFIAIGCAINIITRSLTTLCSIIGMPLTDKEESDLSDLFTFKI